jgi:hypothetical protein
MTQIALCALADASLSISRAVGPAIHRLAIRGVSDILIACARELAVEGTTAAVLVARIRGRTMAEDDDAITVKMRRPIL